MYWNYRNQDKYAGFGRDRFGDYGICLVNVPDLSPNDAGESRSSHPVALSSRIPRFCISWKDCWNKLTQGAGG